MSDSMRDSAGYPVKDAYVVKDSGQRERFDSGMVRDTAAGKVDFRRVLDGPMLDRWAAHLSKGAVKYPDVGPGVPNWTLAAGPAELDRFKQSAFRHFLQWLRGDVDEDHAAAVFFNINGAEYVEGQSLEPAVIQSEDLIGVDIKRSAVEVLDDHGHSGFVPGQKMGAGR